MKIYLIFFSVLLGTNAAWSMEGKNTPQLSKAKSALNFLGHVIGEQAIQHNFLVCLPNEIQLQEIVSQIILMSEKQKEAHTAVVAYLSTCKTYAAYLKSSKESIKAQIAAKDNEVWLTKPIAKNSLTTHLYKQIGYKTWQR